MKLTNNIHIWEGAISLLPVVVRGNDAVFIDPGQSKDRQTLVTFIEENKLNVAGVICTHAHFDHSDNVAFLSQTYACPVASPITEAQIASSHVNLIRNYSVLTPEECKTILPYSCYQTDFFIEDDATDFTFCGITFGVIPLQGHTEGHIGLVLPGNIAYVSDCVFSPSAIDNMKLPTISDLHKDYLSKIRLRNSTYSQYIIAHKGVVPDITETVDYNVNAINSIGAHILSTLHPGDTFEEWLQRFYESANIRSKKPLKATAARRNFESFVRYMLEQGIVKTETIQNKFIYIPTGKPFILH